MNYDLDALETLPSDILDSILGQEGETSGDETNK